MISPQEVRALREARGLSLERFAEAVGIRPLTLAGIERGDTCSRLIENALRYVAGGGGPDLGGDCPSCGGRGAVPHAGDLAANDGRRPRRVRCEACRGSGNDLDDQRVVL